MRTLQEYIEESLLDDLDDLEKISDKFTNDKSSISGYYDVNYIRTVNANYLNKYLDKKAIKQLGIEINQDPHYRVNNSSGTALKSPVAEYINMLVGYIMKLPIYDELKYAMKEKQTIEDSYYKHVNVNEYMPELYKKLSKLFTKDFQIRLHRDDHMMIDFLSYTHIEITLRKK